MLHFPLHGPFHVRLPSCTRFRPALLAGLLLALALPGQASAAAQPGSRFVDLVDFPHDQANWDRFHNLQDHLAGAFLETCVGQVCAPRHLLWPMQLRCSVQAATGRVAACTWVVAGSDLQVRTAGSIEADVVIWRCPLPISRPLDVETFHAALDVAAPLQVRLPGAQQTVLQALRRCLATAGGES